MINWKKNLYVMWVCQFMAMVGMSSVVPFLPLFIRDLGVKELHAVSNWSGLVFAGPFFLSFFLAPVWGSMGDKHGRKIMTLRALIGLAIAQILVGMSQNVYHLFLGRLIQGALSGFIPAAMALIAANTPEEKTGYALGFLQSATAAGNVLGPFIGGLFSDIIGIRNVFFIVATLMTLSSILLMIFVKEEKRKDSISYSYSSNWIYIFKNKDLLTPSILITLIALAFAFIRPVFVLYVEHLGVPENVLPTITGALFSIMGIAATISSAWWGKRVESKGVKKNLIIASFVTGTMYLSQMIINDIVFLYPIMLILGFGFGALLPLLFTSVSKNVSVERRGGVIGVASSFQILGNMLGPIAGGYFMPIIGYGWSFSITAALFFSVSLITPKLKD